MKAVIVDWLRSPFHRAHKGKLANVRPDEMAGQVIRELMKRNNISGSMVDDLILGCAYPEGEQGYNLGRLLTFLGDLPNTVPGATINRLCGSSMQAILSAAAHIEVGWGDCILVGGVESMSRIQRRGFNWSPSPELEDKFPDAYMGMGQTAENVASAWNQTRLQHEEFALSSHQKAASAQINGLLANEIVSIQSDDGVISEDGCIRGNTNLESMAKLKPAFGDDGLVTAATSSPLTDGAVFMIVCSEDFAERHNLKPIARIVAGAVTGCSPDVMGIGPIESIKKVLTRANWGIDDVDLFELNEAFSVVGLANMKILEIDKNKVNIHGGAVSLGHPLGSSGSRIIVTLINVLKQNQGKIGAAGICNGGGGASAMVIELL